MDINLLKQRLAALQNPKGQKKELSQDLWKPSVGKHNVRIVPSAYDKQNPFKELFIHYGINGKTILSPKNYGEKDPIIELSTQLKNTTEWQLGKKLEPKLRVFVPVIVRGEEDKGVRLWDFGKQTYMEFLKWAEDFEEIGDYTSITDGRDIIIETHDKATTGLMFNTSTIRLSVKQTPLSADAEKVKLWMEKQPDPLSIYKRWTYEEIKDALAAHLNPKEEAMSSATDVEQVVDATPAPAAAKSYSLNTSAAKVDDNFDDLFKLD
jgi:hypothetical protein